MGWRGAASIVLAISCVLSGAVGSKEDGRPRPANFLDAPSTVYGPTPVLTDSNGVPVDCEWYGFISQLYDATTGANCLAVLRKALTNATVNDPRTMKPYVYYTLRRLIDSNNNSYCYQGCFNMGGSAAPPAVPPVGDSAPPPFDASAPPPTVGAPAPSTDLAPPPVDFGAPPPASLTPAASPPVDLSSPPGPPPSQAGTPVSSPPVATSPIRAPGPSPMTASNPPASNLVPNGGAILLPTGLLHCFVAGAAVVFFFAAH